MNADMDMIEVPVDGAAGLGVARWGSGHEVVLLSHGITANHLEFQWLADELANEATVYAPDHRGRAASVGVGGPYGFAQHARDLAAIADHVGAQRVSLVGHSMGGFVVAAFAKLFPERVQRYVLVDGGIPLDLPFPEGTPMDDILDAVIGPAMQRLAMRWDDVDGYVDFFRAHPALQPWNDRLEDYVRHDAVTGPDGVRSSVDPDAVRADMAANLADDIGEAVREVDLPGVFLWCDRGILADPPGLYGADKVAREQPELPHLDFRQVPDVNHYTIVMSADGAKHVADALRTAPVVEA